MKAIVPELLEELMKRIFNEAVINFSLIVSEARVILSTIAVEASSMVHERKSTSYKVV